MDSVFRLFVVILFLAPSASKASVFVNDQSLVTAVSNSAVWHKLLHFEAGYFHGARSGVNTSDFFLSPDGRKDAKAELIATIDALTNVAHTQCQFPARAIFIVKNFPNLALPKTQCEGYKAYLDAFQTQSMSLIYASGYLGNPASMYGHVFLKFNDEVEHNLLDNTFSYGAKVPENESPLVYVAKGIFGGYEGKFSNQKYHHQHLTYNESELRDLWEYKLNIGEDDILFLLAHLYELENTKMKYYFFKQNCAFQLAKLLELVIDVPIIAPHKSWVMPYDLIMMLNRHDAEHHLIVDVAYRGSRQEALYAKWNQLSKQEKKSLVEIIGTSSIKVSSVLVKLTSQSAKKVIDTLYDYYAFIEVKESELDEEQAAKKKELLLARFALPAGKTQWVTPIQKPPHMAQDTTMLQVSAVHNEKFGEALELRFRANYYDLLSVNAARIPFSELSTFDLRLLYSQDNSSLEMRELTLLRIINLNASNTDLPFDSEYAWKVAVGYKPQSLSCTRCSNAYVDGFIGKAWSRGKSLAAYGALSVSARGSNESGGYLSAGPEIGGVFNITPQYAVFLAIGYQSYLNDLTQDRKYLAFEQRFLEHRSYDIRTSINYDESFEYAINFSLYY
ncbi:hypothetical protein NBRC116595_24070 [Aliiglaciecola sp. NS0011-25]